MAKVTEDSIEIGLPFALPAIGIHEPVSISVNKAYFQLFVRVVVVVCSALLFWPKVRGAFGFAPPAATEAQTQEIQEKIAKLEHERDQRQAKKGYAVATGRSNAAASPNMSKSTKEPGSAKRRKA